MGKPVVRRASLLGPVPLSVSTDLISICAFRCASLLTAVAGEQEADRVGGRVVEAYPAAALNRLRLPFRGYNGPKTVASDLRRQLIGDLEKAIPLSLEPSAKAAYVDSDHCFDALVCALVARAASLGLTDKPRSDDMETVIREGWIELPTVD